MPTLEIAPGRRIAPPPQRLEEELPRYTLAEIIPLGAGTFRLQPRPLTRWIGINRAVLDRLGILASENTLRRLGRGGFIKVRSVSPSRYEIDFQSYLEHCARVEADPEEFWDTPDATGKTNRKKYLEAL